MLPRILAFCLLVVAVRAENPATLPRTLSTSKQFIIYGSTAAGRLELIRKAQDLQAAWSEATGIADDWKWPIIIPLVKPVERRNPRAETAIFIGDGDSAKIQIDAPDSLLGTSELEVEILRALTLEAAYRDTPPEAGKPYLRPADWLVEGIWQDFAARRDGISAGLFERLVQSGPPPKLEAFLRERPSAMDATSRAIYRAQAMSLLAALVSAPESHKGIAEYISAIPRSRPEDPKSLLAAFPSLQADPGKLVKLWTLALARASESDQIEPLTASETSQLLARILDSLSPSAAPKGNSEGNVSHGAAAMPDIARERSGRFVLSRTAEQLLRIEGRAHPAYRPLVEEYRMLASELAIKPRRNAPKRLAAAEELRKALDVRMEAVNDNLNWFEATQLDTTEEAFLEMPVDEEHLGTPRRNDAISLALDSAEAERQR